jgi:glycosyltransferase involved in cell wall biosynthesis
MPNNDIVSLLMLNWQRPENLKIILAAQADYECIGEILIFNNNKDINFQYLHSKVRILNASHDFGLRSRWILAALASNKYLVFQDDDILLPEEVFLQFIREVSLDGNRAYSLHGRTPSHGDKYCASQVKQEAEIILTRAACIDKTVIPLVLHQEYCFSTAGFTVPILNGEDIFLSYCLTGHFGKKHKILDLPFTELPAPHAIWKRPGHIEQRTVIVQECKRFFLEKKTAAGGEVWPVQQFTHQELPDKLDRSTSQSTKNCVWMRAPINAYTGYGLHALQIVSDFVKDGYDVKLHPEGIEQKFARIPNGVLKRFTDFNNSSWELLLHPPKRPITFGKKTVYFTMWEATQLPLGAVEYLNQAECVVVPCQWNVDCFSDLGVKRPIFRVPLGINTSIFKYFPQPSTGVCIFGTGGRLASGGIRKGVDQVINAFLEAFPSESNVRLFVKIFPDCEIPVISDPRIMVTRKFLKEKEIANWYRSITCFVSAARGEGWGLMQHQALATGRPLISINYGGVKEFFNEAFGYATDYKLVPANGHYSDCGLWAEPNQDSLIANMRYVYNHQNEARILGEKAAKSVSQLSWSKSNQSLLKILHDIGMF